MFDLYALLNETTEEEAIQTLLEEKQNLRRELAEQWGALVAAKNAALAVRNEEVGQLLTKNETLPTNSIFTENEQLVNELYLSSVAIDAFELEEAALERLQTIAEQCSMEGGKVVDRARALYQLFTGQTFIDICNQEEEWEEGANQTILEDLVLENDSESIRVYPNPARQFLQVALPEQLAEQATKATLYSVQGQLVQQWSLEKSTNQHLNTQTIPAGIYWLTISSDNEPLFSQRVVILP